MNKRYGIIKETVRFIIESKYAGAAVYHKPTGLVVRGLMHFDAHEKLINKLNALKMPYDIDDTVDGFVKSKKHGGGFFTRDDVQMHTGHEGESYVQMAIGNIPFSPKALEGLTDRGVPVRTIEDLRNYVQKFARIAK